MSGLGKLEFEAVIVFPRKQLWAVLLMIKGVERISLKREMNLTSLEGDSLYFVPLMDGITICVRTVQFLSNLVLELSTSIHRS